MQCLVLTLGHNSSAILVENGNIVCGYEEERFTGIKSDSRFPINAIKQIHQIYSLKPNTPICVGYWFLDGCLPEISNKYWNIEFIHDLFPKAEIMGLSQNSFTHHDSHMLSAEVFAGPEFPKDHHTLIVDGFGTAGECYSTYRNGNLETSYTGFHLSVGLLYQYATKFCGMKMHEHEYKMLGYETAILRLIHEDKMEELNHTIDYYSDFFDSTGITFNESDLGRLYEIQNIVQAHLESLVYDYEKKLKRKLTAQDVRILVSYFVQRHVENVISGKVAGMNPQNLIVSGGTFYNVKLNSMLRDMTPGKFCAMPLAGDQGAGLGVYQHYFADLKWPGHLYWGSRNLITSNELGIQIAETTDHGFGMVYSEIKHKGMVNLIHGNMEYGPRALCHTSTLAIPTIPNADLINHMNGRTSEMPFSLVVTKNQANDLFMNLEGIHNSLDYMIITRKFKPGKYLGLVGGAHYYPLTSEYTCRPQITHDPNMVRLLDRFGPLINTSFNYHGQPIVYDQNQIEYAHKRENQVYPITTVVIN